ncbi:TPA: hypothetical protein ACF2D8_004669 [Serratia marcescens]
MVALDVLAQLSEPRDAANGKVAALQREIGRGLQKKMAAAQQNEKLGAEKIAQCTVRLKSAKAVSDAAQFEALSASEREVTQTQARRKSQTERAGQAG